uniref:Uncharacterized protein n=1 Tax=Arundo donax TaxID=35708 RepID=A0A0A9A3Y0_ARUDO
MNSRSNVFLELMIFEHPRDRVNLRNYFYWYKCNYNS